MESKVSKRLHIIRVLRRGGVSAAELVAIFVVLVRSILEYGCIFWQNTLLLYLSNKVERVQKRDLRIIYPDTPISKHYNSLKSFN